MYNISVTFTTVYDIYGMIRYDQCTSMVEYDKWLFGHIEITVKSTVQILQLFAVSRVESFFKDKDTNRWYIVILHQLELMSTIMLCNFFFPQHPNFGDNNLLEKDNEQKQNL